MAKKVARRTDAQLTDENKVFQLLKSYWWALLIILPVVGVLAWALPNYGKTQADLSLTGTTAGVVVGWENDQKVTGTVFVALIEGESQKHLCTVGHIGNLANEFGIKEIYSGFDLQGKFVPVGEVGGPERILCAPVETESGAFKLKAQSIPLNSTLYVYVLGGKSHIVTSVEYTGGTMNPKFDTSGASGQVLRATANEYVVDGDSGGAVTLAGDPETVVGVLSGSSESGVFIIPMDYP